ncbi:phage virion morphogenesis protein [Pandoraea sp.]|uniref:phage virion morphogenesis protein n=1 Tax=Pandoraea sp. TaxID=1883445 RepID=UPI00121B0893|nr:phage virion morphogenesis protein [Pandoraea sp.]TAL53826.1 MAG: phage virion morphogenesis protein [Pandoraea sp.]TAM17079.1 MAG: phage virion morphogenesis protein [Pandoraea sp.]
MTNNPHQPLDAWADALLAQLSPAARRHLARQIATDLRRRQQQRIAAQTNPDGTPYEPRKPQFRGKAGRIRRKMFPKLRLARHLKTSATPDHAMLYFTGQVQHVARVHHYGLRDRVQRRGPVVKYPARGLLGLSDEDCRSIEALVLNHLAQQSDSSG